VTLAFTVAEKQNCKNLLFSASKLVTLSKLTNIMH